MNGFMKKPLTLNKEANWVLENPLFSHGNHRLQKKKKTIADNIQLRMLLPGAMLHVLDLHLDNIPENNVKMGDICSIFQMNEHD